MSLIRRKVGCPDAGEKLIPLRAAAELLGLDESTIRKGRAGTDCLTLVRYGTSQRPPIFLIRSEVERFKQDSIDAARRAKTRAESLIFGAAL